MTGRKTPVNNRRSRIYMRAHMPFNIVGGAAIGMIIGSAVNLTSGLREDRAKPEALSLR